MGTSLVQRWARSRVLISIFSKEKTCNKHKNGIHCSLSLILLITFIYKYLEESSLHQNHKHMINFFESLHSVYCCLPFSPAILEWVKKCCVCRNCIPGALNHGLFGYVKCPIYKLKVPAVNEFFVVKASKSAAIDTACTKTVAGEKWYQNFKTDF